MSNSVSESLGLLIDMKAISEAAASEPDRLFGNRTLRAIAPSIDQPAVARLRPIYIHSISHAESEFTTANYVDGEVFEVKEMTYLSFDKHPHLPKRCTARETVFGPSGEMINGGEEVVEMMSKDFVPTCCICYDKLSATSLFTQDNPDYRLHASYLITTSSKRSLCNECVSDGVINPGSAAIDVLSMLRNRGRLGSSSMTIRDWTPHSLKRTSRTGLKINPTREFLSSLSWFKLKESVDLSDPDYNEDSDDDDCSPAGTRTIFYADVPDEYLDAASLRKFNTRPYLSVATVTTRRRSEFTGTVVDGYKVLTLLPTVYSKDFRYANTSLAPTVSYMPEGQQFLALSTSEAIASIKMWEFFVSSSTDHRVYLGDVSSNHGRAGDPHSGLVPFYLLSERGFRNCYACHRSYRHDTAEPCCGTVCPYSGRIPSFHGLTMSSGLLEGLKSGSMDGSNGYSITETRTPTCDVYALRDDTRCELSGLSFICTNFEGSLARPVVRVTLTNEDAGVRRHPDGYLSCAACFCKYRSAGCVDKVSVLDRSSEKQIYVDVHDVEKYNMYLDSMFVVAEVPTVFPKTAPMSIPMQQDLASVYTYLSSVHGVECNLVSPFTIASSYHNTGQCVESDAWSNQSSMSANINRNSIHSISERTITVNAAKNDIERLSRHLGTSCCVPPSKAGSPPATDNTRFQVYCDGTKTYYVPYVYPEVRESLKNWLNYMPESYVRSTYTTLVHYRCSMMAVVYNDQLPGKGVGMLKVGAEDSMSVEDKVCGVLTSFVRTRVFFQMQKFARLTKSLPNVGDFLNECTRSGSLLKEAISYFPDIGSLIMQIDSLMVQENNEAKRLSAGNPYYSLPYNKWGEAPLNSGFGSHIELLKLYNGKLDTSMLTNCINYCRPAVSAESSVNLIRGAQGFLLKRVSQVAGSTPTLSGGLSDGRQLTFQKVWENNFLYIRSSSDEITADQSRPKILNTPPYIWFAGLRAIDPDYLGFSKPDRPITVYGSKGQSRDFGRDFARLRLNTVTSEIAESMSKCYVTWDDGITVRFVGPASHISLRWGDDLRMSSLLSSRMLTVLQQGESALIVVSLRATQIYALEIMQCEYYGKSKSR